MCVCVCVWVLQRTLGDYHTSWILVSPEIPEEDKQTKTHTEIHACLYAHMWLRRLCEHTAEQGGEKKQIVVRRRRRRRRRRGGITGEEVSGKVMRAVEQTRDVGGVRRRCRK